MFQINSLYGRKVLNNSHTLAQTTNTVAFVQLFCQITILFTGTLVIRKYLHCFSTCKRCDWLGRGSTVVTKQFYDCAAVALLCDGAIVLEAGSGYQNNCKLYTNKIVVVGYSASAEDAYSLKCLAFLITKT